MKRCVFLLTYVLCHLFAYGQTVKWHYNLKDVSFGQTSAMDVDGDGKLELIFSTYWNDSNVYCLNAENGTLKWKHRQPGPSGGCNDAGPLIFDPFGNGNYKVVIPGSCMDTTFCVDADSGYVQWKTITGGGDSPPSMADVNGDGQPEVLHGTFYGDVYCLNGRTGAVVWTQTVDANAAIESEPTVVKNNGETDFACATWDFTYDSNRIACYRASDHSLKWQHATHNLLYHGPATGDIDRDGRKELVIGDYDGYLYCLKADDGTLMWKDSVSKQSGGYIGAPVTLADLNNDGYLDIIYMDGNMVRVVNRNDSTEWTYSPPGDFTNFRGAVVADVNNDNIKDVTFCTNYGTILSLDGVTGNVIRSFDFNAYAHNILGDTSSIFEVDNAPIIADFDNDGVLDLFIIGGRGRSDSTTYQDNGYALCLNWGTGKGPAWTMFRHDQRRTACLCDSLGLPLNVRNETTASATQMNIAPNPVSGAFNILFDAAESENVSLTVMDISGKVVWQKNNYQAQRGSNTIRITNEEVNTLPAGMYFVTLRSSVINETQKLVIQKK